MWKYQYERLNRWMDRIVNVGNPSFQMNPEDSKDYIITFFQNCWQFKDWLINDPLLKNNSALAAEIKNFAEQKSIYVKISQNIANGSKHLNFENHDRQSLGLSGKIIGNKQTGIWESAVYEYTEDNATYEVVDLARKCVEEWNVFLEKNNLLN